MKRSCALVLLAPALAVGAGPSLGPLPPSPPRAKPDLLMAAYAGELSNALLLVGRLRPETQILRTQFRAVPVGLRPARMSLYDADWRPGYVAPRAEATRYVSEDYRRASRVGLTVTQGVLSVVPARLQRDPERYLGILWSASVPEPATVLLGAGLGAWAWRRRRRSVDA